MEPTPRERRRRGAAWLWPLLGLLLLLLLIVLAVRACSDDDGDGGAAATTAATSTNGGGSDGSTDLDALLAASGGSLAEFADDDVEVSQGEVQSVVERAGFWLGSADERVFVEVEDETGLDDLGLQEGDSVSFSGRVEKNLEAETYGLRGGDATLFRQQGAHLAVQAGDLERD